MILPDPFQELALFDVDLGMTQSLRTGDCHSGAHTAGLVDGSWSLVSAAASKGYGHE